MSEGRAMIPASQLLKLTIDNSRLKQELFKREIADLQQKTLQAIDEEGKGFGLEIIGFDMDEMAFVIKPEEVKETSPTK